MDENPSCQDLFSYGLSMHQGGRVDEARSVYLQVLDINPRHFDSLHLLGVTHIQGGNYLRALEFIDAAISINPGDAFAYNHRGTALKNIQRIEEALISYNKAIEIHPNFAEAYNNRANAHRVLNKMEDALRDYDRALQIKPDYYEAWCHKGNVCRDLREYDEAVACYNSALGIRSDYADAYHNRGSVLKELKRYEEAVRDFSRALDLRSDFEFLPGMILYTKMHCCDWSGWAASKESLSARLKNGGRVVYPFSALSFLDGPAEQKIAAEIYAQKFFPKSSKTLCPTRRLPDQKIRVGYFSADFHAHATSYLVAELIEKHDRNKFEVYGFSFGPRTGDDMQRRISSAFSEFIDIAHLSDLEAASLARGVGIDIAVDLKGYTQDARPGIFAERAAPVQVNYLAYPGTMGAPFMDYIIADRVVIPAEHRQYYSEEVIYMPHCYQVNDSKRVIADRVMTRAEWGLPTNGLVFCCFNNNYKITPFIFEAWMRVLNKIEGSVLWLLEDSSCAADNLRREAQMRGVGAQRLVFAQRTNLEVHLARHRLADLFLDTLPYNAHTTASDALWAGLPIVTLLGNTFAGRVAASLLTAVGLPELVTHSLEEYEALILDLARDRVKLEGVKSKLLQNRMKYPLFDATSFARDIEAAYIEMVQRGLE